MRYKDIAIAFLIEAKDDLDSALWNLKGKKYSKVVFLCQQCVEKIIKAVLATEGIVGILNHEVSDFLGRIKIPEKWREKIKKVRDCARFLETQGVKPRYPLFGKPNLPVWIPSQRYKRNDALKALKNAKYVVETLEKCLKERGVEIG